MKQLICLIGIFAISFGAVAQDNKMEKKSSPKAASFCALKKKDVMVMIDANGKPLSNDITLSNGTVIKMDGFIAKRGGEGIMLKNGECVDEMGELMKPAKLTSADKKEPADKK